MAYYNRAADSVFLLNDAGTVWTSAAVGSGGALQNSQCAITLGGITTITPSGTTLTLNLAMTFAPAFTGFKTIYMFAVNPSGTSSGWQPRGAWTVP
jgi:hypothetical protein